MYKVNADQPYSADNITHGLIIDSPWIEKILNGEKRWEMRSTATSRRGSIALIKKGSSTVVGTARVVGCAGPLSANELAACFPAHHIPQTIIEAPDYRWNYAWQLTDIIKLEQPVPYHHKSGAVIWVELDREVQNQLRAPGPLIRKTTVPKELAPTTTKAGSTIDPDIERRTRNLANSLGYEDKPLKSAGTHQIELSTIRLGRKEFIYIARKVAISKGQLQVVIHPDVGRVMDSRIPHDSDITIHHRPGTSVRTIESSQYGGFGNKEEDGEHKGFAYRLPLNDGLAMLRKFLEIYGELID